MKIKLPKRYEIKFYTHPENGFLLYDKEKEIWSDKLNHLNNLNSIIEKYEKLTSDIDNIKIFDGFSIRINFSFHPYYILYNNERYVDSTTDLKYLEDKMNSIHNLKIIEEKLNNGEEVEIEN